MYPKCIRLANHQRRAGVAALALTLGRRLILVSLLLLDLLLLLLGLSLGRLLRVVHRRACAVIVDLCLRYM